MTRSLAFCVTIFASLNLCAQTADEVLKKVYSAQDEIITLSYSLVRSDTFVTGQTRIIKGKAKIKAAPGDTIMGFAYWGKRDDVEQETIYDGHLAFSVDHKARQYEISASAEMIPHYLGSPGGQVILKDFIRLDTSGATGFELRQQDQFYLLTMRLPDIQQYDVTNRYRVFYIDRQQLLPMRVILHQESLGKVQNLDYKITTIDINNAVLAYDFSAERYPADYAVAKRVPNKKLNDLVNQPMPFFELKSFNDLAVTPVSFVDKVVLFDFWEVWCGPCIASMPKVDSLFEKYKSQGLQVYGLMSEQEQLGAARLLVNKRNIRFPMLVSNQKIKSVFGINAVPTYILVNRKGVITYITEGFSEALDSEIRKAL